MNNRESTILDLSATDIQNFANNSNAEYELPYIIESLVYATCPGAKYIKFWSRDTNNMPGPDGIVNNESEHLIVPVGTSYWEIGTNKNEKSKADDDYQKRTNEIKRDERMKSTFIFVTPRKWANKEKWITEKRQKKEWKEVMALNSEDIARWLNSCTLAKINFLHTYLYRSTQGVSTLEYEWKTWSYVTTPHLPEYLFDYDVQKNRRKLANWLGRRDNNNFIVAGNSTLECLAFIRCLMKCDEFRHEKERVVVFNDETNIKQIILQDPNCIPIVTKEDLLDKCVSEENSLPVVHVTTLGNSIRDYDIELGLLSRESIRKLASESKNDDIITCAKRCGYSRTLFRKMLNKNAKETQWIKSETSIELIKGMLMLGYGIVDDSAYLDSLLEITKPAIDRKSNLKRQIKELASIEESPVWLKDVEQNGKDSAEMIGLHSYSNAISEIIDYIDDEYIEKIRSFSAREAKNTDAKQRMHRFNSILSVLLILKTQHENDIQLYSDLIEETTNVVFNDVIYAIEREPQNQCEGTLALLAELRPNAFLSWLEGKNEHHCSYNSITLRACAILSKPTEYLRRVVVLISNWYKNTNDTNLRKTYVRFIICLINPTIPQTNASYEVRAEALNDITAISEDLAYQFSIQIAREQHLVIETLEEAKFRDNEWKGRTSINKREVYAYYQLIIDILIQQSKSQVCKFMSTLDILYNFPLKSIKTFLNTANEYYAAQDEVGKGEICGKIVRQILILEQYKTSKHQLQQLNNCLGRLTIDNPFLANLRLFMISNTKPYFQKQRESIELAITVVTACMKNGLCIFDYIDKIYLFDFSFLGYIYSRIEAFDFESFVCIQYSCSKLSNDHFHLFASAYLRELTNQNMREEILPILDKLSIDSAIQFALIIPDSRSLWEKLLALGDNVYERYWQMHKPFNFLEYSDETKDIITLLLDFNLPTVALNSIYVIKDKVPTALFIQIFLQSVKQVWNTSRPIDFWCSGVDELVEFLASKNSLTVLQCATIEFRLTYNITSKPNYSFPYFSSYFASHPAHLAKILKLLHKLFAKQLPSTYPLYLTKKLQYCLYHSAVATKVSDLKNWIDAFLKSSSSLNPICSYETVGMILCAGTIYDISSWLTENIATCIEDFYNSSLSDGFCNSLIESIGIEAYSTDAGGVLESQLLACLDICLSKYHKGFPKTVVILNSMKKLLQSRYKWTETRSFLEKKLMV